MQDENAGVLILHPASRSPHLHTPAKIYR